MGVDASRALVECGDARLEVGGEGLFTRNLLKASRKLAHRLRPARGGVRKDEDVEAHLAEVLGECDGRVDGRLAGGDRHRGRVADDDRPLHERLARLGVDQLGELLQGLHDLAGAFPARGGDDDVDLRVARGRLLENRLAGAERTGNAVGAADCDGEERVDCADRRLQRLLGG